MDEKEIKAQEQEKRKKRRLLIILPLLFLLIAAAVFMLFKTGYLVIGSGNKPAPAATPTPTPIAAEAAQGAYQEETVEAAKNITMPGWASITIAADTTEITRGVDFFNPEANEGYYDMTFELFVDVENSGEYVSVYRSGLVYPGNHVQKITLTQPLSAGTYDAYVHIQPYLKGDQSAPLNNGNVQVELVVQ